MEKKIEATAINKTTNYNKFFKAATRPTKTSWEVLRVHVPCY